MKIIFYNIAYGSGMNGKISRYFKATWRFFWLPGKTLSDIISTLRSENADVVCLAEVDGGSFRNRFRPQAKMLAAKLMLPFSHSEVKYHPRSVWRWMNLIRKQHDAILSKHQGAVKKHHLRSGMKKLVLEFEVGDYSIFTVHLAVLSRRVRQKQLRELAEILKKCRRPYIVCGDFNIHTGLDELKEFIREAKVKLANKVPTFPSIRPVWHLDLFFTSPGVKIKDSGVIPVLHSDHLPVWLELDS